MDLLLHRTILTDIDEDGGPIRARVEILDGVGMLQLRDAWATAIAAHFVRTTRFDPLHIAASDQTLYDMLPGVLDQATEGNPIELRISAGGRDYVVELDSSRLVDAAGQAYSRLEELVRASTGNDGEVTLLLSDRCAGLPGLGDRLAGAAGSEAIALPPEAATLGALDHAAAIMGSGEEVPFLTELVRFRHGPP